MFLRSQAMRNLPVFANERRNVWEGALWEVYPDVHDNGRDHEINRYRVHTY